MREIDCSVVFFILGNIRNSMMYKFNEDVRNFETEIEYYLSMTNLTK